MNDHLVLEDFNDSVTNLFARFVNIIYVDIDVEYDNEKDYNEKLSRKFKLNSQYDHSIIQAFYWLLEDSETSINEFLQYGVEGPTKIRHNEGERYLRLYGLLGAIYNQRSAVIKMYEVFDLGTHKKLAQEFRSLILVEARNMVASHSLDYTSLNGEKSYYRVSRPTLCDSEDLLVLGKNDSISINLKKGLVEFQVFIYGKYINIGRHLIDRFYVKGSDKYVKLSNSLEIIERKSKNHQIRLMIDKSGFIDRTSGEKVIFDDL